MHTLITYDWIFCWAERPSQKRMPWMWHQKSKLLKYRSTLASSVERKDPQIFNKLCILHTLITYLHLPCWAEIFNKLCILPLHLMLSGKTLTKKWMWHKKSKLLKYRSTHKKSKLLKYLLYSRPRYLINFAYFDCILCWAERPSQKRMPWMWHKKIALL